MGKLPVKEKIIEFEQDETGTPPRDRLASRAAREGAFLYELRESFIRNGKYVCRYAFFTAERPERITKGKMRKTLGGLPREMEAEAPEGPERESRGKEGRPVVLYVDGDREKEAEDFIRENGLPRPEASFRETDREELPGLCKAAFYAARKKARLLLAHGRELVDNPAAYEILTERGLDFRSVSFPWMRPANIRLMQAMTLYGKDKGGQEKSKRNKN